MIVAYLPQHEKSYREVLHAMDFHDDGVTHLGDDGVLRSFHPNGTVIEYQKLSPNQIGQMLDGFGRNEHLEEVFSGVSGHSVSHYQSLNPGEDLLPHRFKNSTNSTITSNNTQGLQERGHNPDMGGVWAATSGSQPGRYCADIWCTYHYQCYGMHPACLRFSFPDAIDEGIVRAVCA